MDDIYGSIDWDKMELGLATYWSRSRRELWRKGARESGNTQAIREILLDCDGDALLFRVDRLARHATQAKGPAFIEAC